MRNDGCEGVYDVQVGNGQQQEEYVLTDGFPGFVAVVPANEEVGQEYGADDEVAVEDEALAEYGA